MLWVCEAGAKGWGGKEGGGALGICMLSQGPTPPSQGIAALSCSHLKILLLYFATFLGFVYFAWCLQLGRLSVSGGAFCVGKREGR